MTPSYEKLAAYMAAHGLREGSVSWEHYVADPVQTLPEELITHIYFQIAP
jgi:effector-binding domain-containing protein